MRVVKILLKKGVKSPVEIPTVAEGKLTYNKSFITTDFLDGEDREIRIQYSLEPLGSYWEVGAGFDTDVWLSKKSKYSLFDAFLQLRKEIEERGWMPICQGSRPQAQWTKYASSLGSIENVEILPLNYSEKSSTHHHEFAFIFDRVAPSLVRGWLSQQAFRQHLPNYLFDEYH